MSSDRARRALEIGRAHGLEERERIRALYDFPPDRYDGPQRLPVITFTVQLEEKKDAADLDRPDRAGEDLGDH